MRWKEKNEYYTVPCDDEGLRKFMAEQIEKPFWFQFPEDNFIIVRHPLYSFDDKSFQNTPHKRRFSISLFAVGTEIPAVIHFFHSKVCFVSHLHYSKWALTSPQISLNILGSEYHQCECETSNMIKGFNRTFNIVFGKSMDEFRPDLACENIFNDEVKGQLKLSSDKMWAFSNAKFIPTIYMLSLSLNAANFPFLPPTCFSIFHLFGLSYLLPTSNYFMPLWLLDLLEP